MAAGTVLEATDGPLVVGAEAGQVDRVEVGVDQTLDDLGVVMAWADPVLDDLEVKVVGADQDSVDPEAADGVAQDPTRSVGLEDGIPDLEVTAVVNLQMVGIAQALEPVRMEVGSLVGDFVSNGTFESINS